MELDELESLLREAPKAFGDYHILTEIFRADGALWLRFDHIHYPTEKGDYFSLVRVDRNPELACVSFLMINRFSPVPDAEDLIDRAEGEAGELLLGVNVRLARKGEELWTMTASSAVSLPPPTAGVDRHYVRILIHANIVRVLRAYELSLLIPLGHRHPDWWQ